MNFGTDQNIYQLRNFLTPDCDEFEILSKIMKCKSVATNLCSNLADLIKKVI